MQRATAVLVSVIAGASIAATPAFAQSKPGDSDAPAAQRAPALAPLAVGSLQMASNADLVVEKIDIDVGVDQVAASYTLRNKGAADLSLAADVAIHGLQAARDSGEIWSLPAAAPENPVGLTVAANGAPVVLRTEVRAFALGVDRQAEIAAAHLPLLPFAPEMDKTLAALSPQTFNELSALGIVTPRDPSQPDRKPMADWSLDIVYSWRQTLPAGKITVVTVKYAPLKAEAIYRKADALDIEDLKDEACLTPETIAAAQGKLKSAASALKATEIALVNEPPIRWFDAPIPTVSVRKPNADAIVGFCGMEAKSADPAIVRGTEEQGQDPRDFRVLIFEPITK